MSYFKPYRGTTRTICISRLILVALLLGVATIFLFHENLIHMSSIIWINIPVSPKRVLHTNMLLVCPCYLCFYGYCFAISSRPWTSLVVCARYWVSLKSASFFAPDALLATLLRDGSTFSFLCSFCASMMPFFTVLNSPSNWWVVSAWRGFNNVNPYLPCYYLNFLSFSQVCFKVSLEIFPCLFFWVFFHTSRIFLSRNNSYPWWCSNLFQLSVWLSMGS